MSESCPLSGVKRTGVYPHNCPPLPRTRTTLALFGAQPTEMLSKASGDSMTSLLDFAMSQIRTALVSLGNHAMAFVSQTGLSKEILAFPPIQFWITPSTVFTMGGFALFATLAFAGVANMNKRFRPLLTGVYVLAALLLLIGCLQAARQEQAAAETQKLSASLVNPTPPVQPDITVQLLDPKEPTEDRDKVDVPPKIPRRTAILQVTHPRIKYWGD
jgi:hypothetical protein